MAHHVEPMDVDTSVCDFDNKENTFLHSNVLSRTPCTEKGYEELDVSELNMKLRYTITPAASPMSKSYTDNCVDNLTLATGENAGSDYENGNLTVSINSAISKSNDFKPHKALPLRTLLIDQPDSNRSILQPLDSTITVDSNITVNITSPNDIDENISYPSSSSSLIHTPEATTPTKEISKDDGSPIMRGLKSVLSMFRPSQSPISTAEDIGIKADVLSPPIVLSPNETTEEAKVASATNVMISTPIAAHKTHDALAKRNSPNRQSIVFKDDLQKELQWEDETTVLFCEEKIPIHKLWLQQTTPVKHADNPTDLANITNEIPKHYNENIYKTVEYMDISYSESLKDQTQVILANESDGDFLDCETTFTKNDSQVEQSFQSLDNEAEKEHDEIEQVYYDDTVTSLDATLSKSPTLSSASIHSINVMTETEETVKNKKNNERSLEIIKPECNSNPEVETAGKSEEDKANFNSKDNFIGNDKDTAKQKSDEFVSVINDIGIVTDSNTETTNVQTAIPELKPLDSIVINTLSQIPLIADPRVLLFNISSKPVENAATVQVKDKTPNDLPLPDDDDGELVSLPFVQENIDDVNAIQMFAPNIFSVHKENVSQEIAVSLPTENILSECVLDSFVSVEIPVIEGKEICNVEIVPEHEDEFNKESSTQILTPATLAPRNIEEKACASYSTKVISKNEATKNATHAHEKHMPLLNELKDQNHSKNTSINFSENPELVNLDDTTSLVNLISSLTDIMVEAGQSKENSFLKQKQTENISIQENVIKIEEPVFNVVNNVSNDSLCNKLKTENIFKIVVASGEANIPAETDIDLLSKEVLQTTNCEDLCSAIDTTIDSSLTYNETAKLPSQASKSQHIGEESDELPIVAESVANSTFTNIQTQVKNGNKTEETGVPIISPDETACELSFISVKQTKDPKIAANEICLTYKIEATQENQMNHDKDDTLDNTEKADQKMVTSKNGPFVSLSAEEIPEGKLGSSENIRNVFKENSELTAKVPSSPPIMSRGYNFNFDDIENPFATKTTIRVSTSPGQSPNKSFEQFNYPDVPSNYVEIPKLIKKNDNQNKPKYQSNKKEPVSNKQLNSIFAGDLPCTKSKENAPEVLVDSAFENKHADLITENVKVIANTTFEGTNESFDITNNQPDIFTKTYITPVESCSSTSGEPKNILSSVQSHYSAGTSFTEGEPKSVFNIPEIDDSNFNPFAPKSRVCMSPLPKPETTLSTTQSKLRSSPEQHNINDASETNSQLHIQSDINKEETLVNTAKENKNFNNNSNETNSSNTSDYDKNFTDNTVREVNTEDDDTVEGPFLEGDLNDNNINDLKPDDKMQFTDSLRHEENTETGELFIDAEAFEFLLSKDNHGVADSGKESLFLKFDPLFAKRMSSEGVVAALSKYQKKQSTPKRAEPLQNDVMCVEKIAIDGPSTLTQPHESDVSNTAEECSDELNMTVSKPMMIVNPAVVPMPSTRSKVTTSVRSNRHSLTFTSPAIAVIDRLLSISVNNSFADHDTTIAQVHGDNEAEMALTQLRELLADKEINVFNLKSESKELKQRLENLESQMKTLEQINEERLKNINELNGKLIEKSKSNKEMAAVVEEYERTIASLIAETEQDKKLHAEERNQLMKERDEQTAHLTSMEVSFSDLHSKYEKSKQVILGLKSNEDAVKMSIKDLEENLVKMQKNYEMLKQHATSKLNHANEELQKINKSHEAEMLKLNAMIKRKELDITSLEETLLQKTKANDELTAICDELINKVG